MINNATSLNSSFYVLRIWKEIWST